MKRQDRQRCEELLQHMPLDPRPEEMKGAPAFPPPPAAAAANAC